MSKKFNSLIIQNETKQNQTKIKVFEKVSFQTIKYRLKNKQKISQFLFIKSEQNVPKTLLVPKYVLLSFTSHETHFEQNLMIISDTFYGMEVWLGNCPLGPI